VENIVFSREKIEVSACNSPLAASAAFPLSYKRGER